MGKSLQQLLVTNFALNPSGYTGSRGDIGYVGSAGAGAAVPKIAAIAYPGDDTAADVAGGQTITITGTGFASGAAVIINGIVASVVSFINSTTITFTAPALAAGSYIVYVVNTDGSTALAVPGIQYSGTPSWSTAAGSLATTIKQIGFTANLVATGDSPITYSVLSGSLPTGLTLTANTGVISGTTPNVSSDTTYNFTIRSTDAQQQDTDRAFSITVVPLNPPPTVEYLVIAGGGGGGGAKGIDTYSGGGGGAGGYLTGLSLSVTNSTPYTITVGAGGTGGTGKAQGSNGSDSIFLTITASGGGGGGYDTGPAGSAGSSGGSGGGGGSYDGAAGSGNVPSTSPAQGNNGGRAGGSGSGGGGGAGGIGGAGSAAGGAGGNGVVNTITGTATTYAGGGGGGIYFPGNQIGAGGTGGGGSAGALGTGGTSGTANTGGGGGGSSGTSTGGATNTTGGSGGSGVVIIRFADSYSPASSTTGSPAITTSGGYRIYQWTTSGSITF